MYKRNFGSILIRVAHPNSANKRAVATVSHVDLHCVTIDEYKSPAKISPLLILHGLFGHTGNWNSVAKALNRRLKRKVILADLRNHGNSPHVEGMGYKDMASDVEHLILKMAPESQKCILLGHSLGGKVACEVALNNAHLIEKLIVEDMMPRTIVRGDKNDMGFLADAMLNVQCPQMNLAEARRRADEQLEEMGVKLKNIRQFLLTNLTDRSGAIGWKLNLPVIQKFMDELYTFPEDSLKKIYDGPCLFLFGRRSPYYKGSADDFHIKSIFPQAHINFIEDCGHWLHSEKPNEFIDAVANFTES